MKNYKMYAIEMEVNKDVWDNKCELLEAKKSFMENVLSKILPTETFSGGYICTCCETYLDNLPNNLCNLCLDHYKQKRYTSYNPYTLLYVFSIPLDIEFEFKNLNNIELEGIKILDFQAVEPNYEYSEAQYLITFKNDKFDFTDVKIIN